MQMIQRITYLENNKEELTILDPKRRRVADSENDLDMDVIISEANELTQKTCMGRVLESRPAKYYELSGLELL